MFGLTEVLIYCIAGIAPLVITILALKKGTTMISSKVASNALPMAVQSVLGDKGKEVLSMINNKPHPTDPSQQSGGDNGGHIEPPVGETSIPDALRKIAFAPIIMGAEAGAKVGKSAANAVSNAAKQKKDEITDWIHETDQYKGYQYMKWKAKDMAKEGARRFTGKIRKEIQLEKDYREKERQEKFNKMTPEQQEEYLAKKAKREEDKLYRSAMRKYYGRTIKRIASPSNIEALGRKIDNDLASQYKGYRDAKDGLQTIRKAITGSELFSKRFHAQMGTTSEMAELAYRKANSINTVPSAVFVVNKEPTEINNNYNGVSVTDITPGYSITDTKISSGELNQITNLGFSSGGGRNSNRYITSKNTSSFSNVVGSSSSTTNYLNRFSKEDYKNIIRKTKKIEDEQTIDQIADMAMENRRKVERTRVNQAVTKVQQSGEDVDSKNKKTLDNLLEKTTNSADEFNRYVTQKYFKEPSDSEKKLIVQQARKELEGKVGPNYTEEQLKSETNSMLEKRKQEIISSGKELEKGEFLKNPDLARDFLGEEAVNTIKKEFAKNRIEYGNQVRKQYNNDEIQRDNEYREQGIRDNKLPPNWNVIDTNNRRRNAEMHSDVEQAYTRYIATGASNTSGKNNQRNVG